MIVTVDASVAAMWFVPQKHSDRASLYLASDYQLVAPDLILLEIGSVLLKAVGRKELTAAESRDVLRSLLPGALRIVTAAEHAETAFGIAQRFGGSIYDAVYIAVARALDIPVLTNDRGLARVAERAKVRALLVGDMPPAAG